MKIKGELTVLDMAERSFRPNAIITLIGGGRIQFHGLTREQIFALKPLFTEDVTVTIEAVADTVGGS